MKIYRENFEKAYLNSEIEFYNKHAQQFIVDNGIISYLTYADTKLKEEEKRAHKYLETCKGSDSIELVIKLINTYFIITNSLYSIEKLVLKY